jgi:hypothetical protein
MTDNDHARLAVYYESQATKIEEYTLIYDTLFSGYKPDMFYTTCAKRYEDSEIYATTMPTMQKNPKDIKHDYSFLHSYEPGMNFGGPDIKWGSNLLIARTQIGLTIDEARMRKFGARFRYCTSGTCPVKDRAHKQHMSNQCVTILIVTADHSCDECDNLLLGAYAVKTILEQKPKNAHIAASQQDANSQILADFIDNRRHNVCSDDDVKGKRPYTNGDADWTQLNHANVQLGPSDNILTANLEKAIEQRKMAEKRAIWWRVHTSKDNWLAELEVALNTKHNNLAAALIVAQYPLDHTELARKTRISPSVLAKLIAEGCISDKHVKLAVTGMCGMGF